MKPSLKCRTALVPATAASAKIVMLSLLIIGYHYFANALPIFCRIPLQLVNLICNLK